MTNQEPRTFKSGNYGRTGEFLLSLSAVDYGLVMHALVLAGTVVADRRGIDAARPYDELHDRLMDWNPE
mgnify:CR=1 FL=1|jgi:hypothetical protein|tara:strand:- start:425 stop:631 length:207 start_codon:yes stop_codon:yes gene_type:complete